MIDRSTAIGIVEQSWQTVARSFTQLDIALDDGLEDQVLEVLLDLLIDLIVESGTAIVHSHEEAFDLQPCIETLADDTDGIQELRDPLEGKVLALHGDEHRVCSHERIDRDQAQRRGAVDEDVVVGIDYRLQDGAQDVLSSFPL